MQLSIKILWDPRMYSYLLTFLCIPLLRSYNAAYQYDMHRWTGPNLMMGWRPSSRLLLSVRCNRSQLCCKSSRKKICAANRRHSTQRRKRVVMCPPVVRLCVRTLFYVVFVLTWHHQRKYNFTLARFFQNERAIRPCASFSLHNKFNLSSLCSLLSNLNLHNKSS